jgi:hypothetical protein
MLFVSPTPDGDNRHVVVITLPGDVRLIGFITDSEPVQAVPELSAGDGEKVLTVYLPMVLTAGMNRPPAEIPQVQQAGA